MCFGYDFGLFVLELFLCFALLVVLLYCLLLLVFAGLVYYVVRRFIVGFVLCAVCFCLVWL